MNYLIVILMVAVQLSYGQTEDAKMKLVSKSFVEYYNSDNHQQLFSMFADAMKEALPLDQTIDFVEGLKSQAGNISAIEFLNYENGTYAKYKTTFERVVLSLHLSLDKDQKINGLFVKPYAELPELSTNIINQLSTQNGLISKGQVQMIVEKTKVLPPNTQLSIAFIRKGVVGYYGLINKSDTLSCIDNQNSIFEIGSISKVFTATLLANLLVDRQLEPPATINRYLKIRFKNKIKIRFIDLANHSTGLPRLPSNFFDRAKLENPYIDYTEKELKEYLSKYLELSNKGESQYSNLGAGLLAYTLCKIEKDSYEHLLQQKIFSKYAMQHSTTIIDSIKTTLVRGLNSIGQETPNWSFSVLAGAGAILSSTKDLSTFALAQFDTTNKELSLTRQKTVEITPKMDMGLGWHLLKSSAKNTWHWHNGATGGYSSSMVIDVKSKNGVIILSNVSAFNPNMNQIDQLCFELMQSLYNTE